MSIQDDTRSPPSVKYPTSRSGSHWSHKVTRLLMKSCAAQDIGTTAVMLVTYVAHTEDARKYSGPVTFYNDQLLPLLGVAKWDTLAAARKKAVEAGWLHYHNPNPTGRSPGYYWSLVPADLAGSDDAPTDEGWSPEETYQRGYRDGYQAALTQRLYPKNGDSDGDSSGDSHGDSHGDSSGDSHGEPSIPIPIPNPNPKRESAPEKPQTVKPPKAGTNIPPSLEEVTAFVNEHSLKMDPADFHDYYESNGWKVGKASMKDWHSSVRRWARQQTKFNGTSRNDLSRFSGAIDTENLPTKGFRK